MCLCYLFSAKTAWQLVNRKADFFYKTNWFESIRIANWNALATAWVHLHWLRAVYNTITSAAALHFSLAANRTVHWIKMPVLTYNSTNERNASNTVGLNWRVVTTRLVVGIEHQTIEDFKNVAKQRDDSNRDDRQKWDEAQRSSQQSHAVRFTLYMHTCRKHKRQSSALVP